MKERHLNWNLTSYWIHKVFFSKSFWFPKFLYQAECVVACRSLIFSSYLILCPTKLNFFRVSCSNSITIISLIEYNLDKRPKTWNKLVWNSAKSETLQYKKYSLCCVQFRFSLPIDICIWECSRYFSTENQVIS